MSIDGIAFVVLCFVAGISWGWTKNDVARAIYVLVVAVCALGVVLGRTAEAVIAPDALLDAIEHVESSGRGADTPDGDSGRAVGCLQIWQSYLDDANEWAGTSFTHAEMRDPEKARFIAVAYLDRWGTHYEKVTGERASLSVLARMHKSGPNGWKKPETLAYWDKVKARMEAVEARR